MLTPKTKRNHKKSKVNKNFDIKLNSFIKYNKAG